MWMGDGGEFRCVCASSGACVFVFVSVCVSRNVPETGSGLVTLS